MIEFRNLVYFTTVCRSESLAVAARHLGVAVSTLSTTMKALESDLGSPLFRRLNSGLYPTEAARGVMRSADVLLMAESFARRWAAASPRAPLQVLTVNLALSYAIGGLSRALCIAIDRLGRERPNLLIDPLWSDEKDGALVDGIATDWTADERHHVTVALADSGIRDSRYAMKLRSDPWVFACRLPAGTRRLPTASELAAGRLVVPSLSPQLIEQADRYFAQHKIRGVRFLTDHPGDLPRLVNEHSDAALFIPQSLTNPRLGLVNVTAIMPDQPLTMSLAARTVAPNAVTTSFMQHLKRALQDSCEPRLERPAVSLRQIRYFNNVHRLRRVSAAARSVNISQPALSEQLQSLETALGRSLFNRQGDGMVPTTHGERFALVAQSIEMCSRKLAEGTANAAPPQSRRISLGILPSVNQHGFLVNRITEAMFDLTAKYPTLKLTVREAPNGLLQDWVIRGLVGVAIVETALPHMPRLPLGSSENLAAIAHHRFDPLPPGPVALADLANVRLALPSNRFGLRRLFDAAAEQHGIRIQPSMEIDALPMVIAMLDREPICTVLPLSAVQTEVNAGELVVHPIVAPVIARQLFVIYSGERVLSAPERGLVNALRTRLSTSKDNS